MKLKWPSPDTFALIFITVWFVFLSLPHRFWGRLDFGWKHVIGFALFAPIYYGYLKIYKGRNDTPIETQLPKTKEWLGGRRYFWRSWHES